MKIRRFSLNNGTLISDIFHYLLANAELHLRLAPDSSLLIFHYPE